MSPELPNASIRRQVMIPLRFVDWYTKPARVLTFDGLVDGRVRRDAGANRRVRVDCEGGRCAAEGDAGGACDLRDGGKGGPRA